MSKAQIQNLGVEEQNAKALTEIWLRFCTRFKSEVGEAVYSSWFKCLELDQIVNGVAYLSVPTKFLKSWIHAHYLEKLRATVVQELPGVTDIVLNLRATTRIAPPTGAERPVIGGLREIGKQDGTVEVRRNDGPARKMVEGLEGSSLDRRLVFANFLVGPSNQLAHAASQQVVAAGPGMGAMFNPLYIFSNVGLGKTHLIQAIAHAGLESGRRVVYLTAEKFMYGFVAALKAQNSIVFKEKLRSIDLLVIDDVQFLQGKTIQHEFCHTLNALIDSGKQVVIAGDRAPNELDNLDERVRSRFAGGLCVEMQALDEALRGRILEARIEAARIGQPGFEVSKVVMAMVARAIDTNGRDLDGAVNRLLAHTILAGAPLTVEAAEAAIRDLIRVREPKRVKIEDIQKLVATHFNVSRADILSSRRTANVVRPRQIAMYLAKTMTLRSLPEIGRRFGGRDHTTVLHAVRKIEDLVSKDSSLNQELELLKRLLSD
ncbi:chromosomal replication initiator protein DnaA [Rhodoblastus sp.]|uniref:chromosomal replication initiator protein DnaA n=1 Tax=Rhodoblastus sp. TaxID=1962975 RepID=UPI0035B26EC3